MEQTPGEIAVRVSENKAPVYPPDLINAIGEARRVGRANEVYNIVRSKNPKLVQVLMTDGYEAALQQITKNTNKEFNTAEDWALYEAVQGNITKTGDFLEVARTRPKTGFLTSERMFVILALAYERNTQHIDYKLDRIRSDRKFSSSEAEQIDELLDERNFCVQQSQYLKDKADKKEWEQVSELARSDKFAKYEQAWRPRVASPPSHGSRLRIS